MVIDNPYLEAFAPLFIVIRGFLQKTTNSQISIERHASQQEALSST